MSFRFSLEKLTSSKWLNLFNISYEKDGKTGQWVMCSRKKNPIIDSTCADAVVIIPIIKTKSGNKLVLIREFRIPIGDYLYGFAAGLIDKGESVEDTIRRELKEETGLNVDKIVEISMPVFSSAGMSDESNHMALVEASGNITNKFLEDSEDIEVVLMNSQEIRELLKSQKRIAAKAWAMLYHFASKAAIEF